jgi:hypothetical protein
MSGCKAPESLRNESYFQYVAVEPVLAKRGKDEGDAADGRFSTVSPS